VSHFLLCRSGYVPAYALKEILSALASDVPEAKNRAYYWTFVIFLAHLSFAQVDLIQSWHSRRCYERTRGQLFCTMHYKSLKRQEMSGRLNPEGETSNADLGKTLNLMQSVFRIPRSKFKSCFNFYFLEATLMPWLNDSGNFLQYLLRPCAS
jgi:hypothetical protein